MRDWNCKHTLHIRNPLLLHFFHTFHMTQQKDDRVNTGEGLRSWNDDGCGLWKHGKKWMFADTYRRYADILWNRTNAWTFPLIVKNKQNCYICSSLSFHFKHDQYEMLAKYIWYVVCESGVRKLGPIGNTALNKCTAKTCCTFYVFIRASGCMLCAYKQHTCLQVCDQPEMDNRKCLEREKILWNFFQFPY